MTLRERISKLDARREELEARVGELNRTIAAAREEGQRLVAEHLKTEAKIEQLQELLEDEGGG